MTELGSGWRGVTRWLVLAGATLLAALAVAVGVGAFASRGQAAGDSLLPSAEQTAIVGLIAEHQTQYGSCFVVPPEALKTVLRRLAQLSPENARPVEEGEQHRQVLPDSAITMLNERYSRYLDSTCTAHHAAELGSRDWATEIDDALYNNPDSPPLVATQSKVLAVECKRRSGDECLVWALMWGGDITTTGCDVQARSVYEYSLRLEDGEWRVDSDLLIAHMTAATSRASWGPDAPHQPIAACEQMLNSSLYPGQRIPDSELLSLEAHVVK